MEEKLINYLKEKYNPLGIILHGSRSNDSSKKHSDWDFFVLTKDNIKNDRKYEPVAIHGQFLDVVLWHFPVEETYIKKYFAMYLVTAKLVFCKDSSVSEMFSNAQMLNKQGLILSNEEIKLIKDEIDKSTQRISDLLDDKYGTFFLRSSDLYRTLYNSWWNIKMKKYSIPIYKGMDIIKKEDPEFFKLLQIVYSNKTNKKKYEALVKLKENIFN